MDAYKAAEIRNCAESLPAEFSLAFGVTEESYGLWTPPSLTLGSSNMPTQQTPNMRVIGQTTAFLVTTGPSVKYLVLIGVGRLRCVLGAVMFMEYIKGENRCNLFEFSQIQCSPQLQ